MGGAVLTRVLSSTFSHSARSKILLSKLCDLGSNNHILKRKDINLKITLVLERHFSLQIKACYYADQNTDLA